jgi:hypothetical protein
MKTMTCKQMGGPCDAAFHANTADEVIKAEDRHLKEVVASGDETHKSARKSFPKTDRSSRLIDRTARAI